MLRPFLSVVTPSRHPQKCVVAARPATPMSTDTSITDSNFGNISNQGNANGIPQAVRSTERRLQFSANYRF